jgi:S-DNA-T family DNA segregation ATPase FtsK/SpoIIIE
MTDNHSQPQHLAANATDTPPGGVIDVTPTRRPLPEILPAWLSSLATTLATISWFFRYLLRKIAFHALRIPVYLARWTWWALRGAWFGLAAVVSWLTGSEYRPALTAARATGTWDEFVDIHATKRDTARTRRRIVIALTVIVANLVAFGLAYYPAVVWSIVDIVAIIAVVSAVVTGKPAQAPILSTTPDMPVRLDMSATLLAEALRAAGVLKPDVEPVLVTPILRDAKGWSVTFDMPRGGGKTAADVIAKRHVIAAELGVDEIQVIVSRIRATNGGHAGRVALWVADDDPYMTSPTVSPLAKAKEFSVWDAVPFGHDARGKAVVFSLMWQSIFFGGLPRRGKTFAQRLATAAAVLDAHTRHYVADGKGGADWQPMRHVAHRLVLGAETEALQQFMSMLDELIEEMSRRFTFLGSLPLSVCPEGKLTPQISTSYGLPVIVVTIDELQEYFSAMDTAMRDLAVEKLARLARRAPAAGFILNLASQRPDSESVPSKLREMITYRYCTQVVDRTSSDMVLGKGKASQGADASMLSEHHTGVGVLVTGPGSFEIVKADYLDVPTFAEVCQRGRALRIAAGTLSGDAANDTVAKAVAAGVVIPLVLADVLMVMHGIDRMHTTTILDRLVNLDEDAYHSYSSDQLADELEGAGVIRTGKQVKIDGRNLAGYRRSDLEAAVPAGAVMPEGRHRAPDTVGDEHDGVSPI